MTQGCPIVQHVVGHLEVAILQSHAEDEVQQAVPLEPTMW
jgi:hypothetical protein